VRERPSSQEHDIEGHKGAGYCHGNVKTSSDDGKLVEDASEAFLLGQKHGLEPGDSSEIRASAD